MDISIMRHDSDNSDVILNFDVRKPISFADIKRGKVIGLFALCQLFVLFLHDVIKRGRLMYKIERTGGHVLLSDVVRMFRFYKREILISIFLILLANILCIPLWTELGYVSFMRTLFNKEARLDLVYEGRISDSVPFYLQSTPKPLNDPSPSYVPQNHSQQTNLNFRARGKWQKVSLQIQSQRNGTIMLRLRGAEVRDEYGHFYSVLTDWRNLKINGTVVFKANKQFSFQKCFSRQISVKGNETLRIEAEFRRHHFTIHDFTFLKQGNLWYLITGNFLFFFLIWSLFPYFSKRCGSVRLGDALLIFAFFSLIFIPMVDISDEVYAYRENRMLAVKPKIKEILKGNTNTGGVYEKWFNDHFYGRIALMKLYNSIQNMLSLVIRTEKAIYFKENGWDFLTPLVSNLNCSSTTLHAIVQNLLQLDLFCRQHNIKLYVLEVPKKENVYKEIIEDKYGFNEKQFVKVSRAQDFIRSETRRHHIPYVYPYKALRDASKQDFVFFKCCHHWTDWGAFVGYRELMKEVCKDFSDIPVVSLKDYRKSQNCLQREEYKRDYAPPWHFWRFFNDEHLDDHSYRTFYNYYDHKNGDRMAIKVGKFTKDFAYPSGKRRVMLIGTSQNENFLQFLPYSAAQTKYLRLNMGQVKESDEFKILKLYMKDILTFNPDILVLSIHTDNLPRLCKICTTQ